jgi:hypothetical protein
MDPRSKNDEEPIQKTLSPKGYGEKGSAASLLASRGPMKGTLLSGRQAPHASSATHFGRNVGIHSFSTDCWGRGHSSEGGIMNRKKCSSPLALEHCVGSAGISSGFGIARRGLI